MHDNLFTFANNQSLEYDFLHWCLLWYKDKSEPRNPLFYMAKDLLAIMGEDQLTDDQEIDICRWEYAGIDLLVNLRGLNRVLVIDHSFDMLHDVWDDDHDEEMYYLILNKKKILRIDGSVTIRKIGFERHYCAGTYCDSIADYEIYKESLLGVLEKYENINNSLDVYIASLRERIASERRLDRYEEAVFWGDAIDWRVSRDRIAQHHFIDDMFGCMFGFRPDDMPYDSEAFWMEGDTRIVREDGSGTIIYPWTECFFTDKTCPPGRTSDCGLCWHLGADGNGPSISLRLQVMSKCANADCFERIDKMLKQRAEDFFSRHSKFGFNWSDVKSDSVETDAGKVSARKYSSVILSIPLQKLLEHWRVERVRLQHMLIAATDYFMQEFLEIM